MIAIVSNGIRLPAVPAAKEALTITELCKTVAAMWTDEAAQRPTMSDVAPRFEALLRAAVGSTSFDGTHFFVAEPGAASPMDVTDHAAVSGLSVAKHGVADGAKVTALPEAVTKISSVNGGFSGWSSEDAKTLERISASLGLAEHRLRKVGWEASPGRRGADRMEDRTIACSGPGVTLSAVFDGHNGDAAAEFCRVHIADVLEASAERGGIAAGKVTCVDAAAAALRSAFVTLNEFERKLPMTQDVQL